MSTYDPGPDIAEGGTPITDAPDEEVLATNAEDDPATSSGRTHEGAFAEETVTDDSPAVAATAPAIESPLDAAAAAGPLTWSVRPEDEEPPPLGGDGIS